jgi:tripartite-type tricarboxylate transporter receptor subunit TctC
MTAVMRILVGLAFVFCLTSVARAQGAYPNRSVRIVIPFPAGSALDGLTRIIAEQLQGLWGQGVVVENVVGGGGNVGADRVFRADPDGYTLLAAPPGPLSFNNFLFKDTRYDPTTFVPVTLMASVPNALIIRKTIDAPLITDFLALLRANPGKFNYASQGVSSTGYLTARLFEQRTGVSMVHVPYRGAAPALTDIVAGHVDMFFDTLTTSLPLHRGNQARVIGVADIERSQLQPDIPTFHEAGVKDLRSITWFGLVLPPKSSEAIARKINGDVATILLRPEVAERIKEMNMTPGGGTPAQAAQFFRVQTQMWTTLIKSLNLELQ